MNKFMKMAILFASVLFAGSVLAQNPPTISCGDYRVAPPNTCGQPGAVVYNHAGYPTNGRIGGGNLDWLANQAIRIPVNGVIPQGYCTWSDRLKNVLISGGIGGILGALVGDNGRAAGQGAAAGMLTGTVIPCDTQQQYLEQRGSSVVYGQQPVQQGNPCADQGRIPVIVNGETKCKLPNAPQQVAQQQFQQVAQSNPCADQGRIAVYKPDGNVGCKLPDAPAQPGERPYL